MPRIMILQSSLLAVITFFTAASKSIELCPISCYCEASEKISCERANFERIPSNWTSSLRSLTITNCSLQRIHKNAFKRYPKLEEVIIRHCTHLVSLEKHSFKGLVHLRLLRLEGNPNLKEIERNAFSHISSKHRLRIQLSNNGFMRILPGMFRHANRLRELNIEREGLRVERHAFANLVEIDFFNISGAAVIEPKAFENLTRVHKFEIIKSSLTLTKGIFSSVSHISELHITSNELDSIETDAFGGLFTVRRLILAGNVIGNFSGHAFSSVVNVGSIIVEANTISHLDTEALLSSAHRIRFMDNTLRCSCDLIWIKHSQDEHVLKKNFCGVEEHYRSLINFSPKCRVSGGLSSASSSSNLSTLSYLLYLLLPTLYIFSDFCIFSFCCCIDKR